MSRYLFPPISNTTHEPTKSAEGNVCRKSTKFFQCACDVNVYHLRSGPLESACRRQNASALGNPTTVTSYYSRIWERSSRSKSRNRSEYATTQNTSIKAVFRAQIVELPLDTHRIRSSRAGGEFTSTCTIPPSTTNQSLWPTRSGSPL
jgi:hypothetical protein